MFKLMAAAALSVLPAMAQAVVYECKVNPGSLNGGYITEVYLFEYLPETKSIQIFDALIANFNKEQPVDGKVSGANDTKMSFSWDVHLRNSAGQKTKLAFRSVLYMATSEFSVQANPVGYIDKFHARGTCSVVQ